MVPPRQGPGQGYGPAPAVMARRAQGQGQGYGPAPGQGYGPAPGTSYGPTHNHHHQNGPGPARAPLRKAQGTGPQARGGRKDRAVRGPNQGQPWTGPPGRDRHHDHGKPEAKPRVKAVNRGAKRLLVYVLDVPATSRRTRSSSTSPAGSVGRAATGGR